MREITNLLEEAPLADLFTPEYVLPEQYFQRPSLSCESGERALQWAVFADGIETFRRFAHSRSKVGRREFNRTKAWIQRNDWGWLYSFVNLCATFGFDPTAVRNALRQWEREGEDLASQRRRFRHAA